VSRGSTGGDDGHGGEGVVAVVGEALMDLVPGDRDGLFEAAPGGSPANVAVGLARLRIPVRLLARLADDAFGHRLRNHLVANQVDLSRAVVASEPSSLAIVAVAPDGGAEYDFRIDGTADWQWRDEELAAALDPDVVAVHAGSLAAVLAPGSGSVRRLLERARDTATVSYDPNCRPLLMGTPEEARRQVEDLVGLADVVKVSREDLAWLVPGRAPDEVAAAWAEQGPALVAVTLGAEGVVAVGSSAGVVRRPGRRVDVVDTVGAGDSFTAALVAGLWRRDLLGAARRPAMRALDAAMVSEVLDEAVLASALTCARRGADPPTAAELRSAAPA
jgi:fructokinase